MFFFFFLLLLFWRLRAGSGRREKENASWEIPFFVRLSQWEKTH
jgi:hypothetical protein